jgi:Flp pilus assembly protein TadG
VKLRGRGARGQATVEFALVLPLVLGLALFIVQVGLVVRDQIMVVNAAREGARTAAVQPLLAEARQSAIDSGALDPQRTTVLMSQGSATVTVTVSYQSTTTVPIIGTLVGDITMSESTTMRSESR